MYEGNEAKSLAAKEKIIDYELKNQAMKRDIEDMTELVNAAKLMHINAIQAITYQEVTERTPPKASPLSKKENRIEMSAHKHSSSTKPPS